MLSIKKQVDCIISSKGNCCDTKVMLSLQGDDVYDCRKKGCFFPPFTKGMYCYATEVYIIALLIRDRGYDIDSFLFDSML